MLQAAERIEKLTEKTSEKQLAISAPNFRTAAFQIVGIAPYVQNKFSEKAKQQMHETQAGGSTSKKGKKRDPKDFDKCFEQCMYQMKNGDRGIPATAFRNACISACRVCGFKMTHAKLSIFIEADGFDKHDSTPLVKITKGEPKYTEMAVRNDSGVCDLRVRAMWEPGWSAVVRVRFDADQFTTEDVANLMHRVGLQVGIGEGRPDSRDSSGLGWGMFTLADKK
jgi:hypothetical protein